MHRDAQDHVRKCQTCMRLKPNQVQTAGKMLTPEIVLEVNTSISESSGYILSFLTQGREP